MATRPGASVDKTALIDLAQANSVPPVSKPDQIWYRTEISGVKWDALYPYQLIAVEQVGLNQYAPFDKGRWTFTLPIPPQSLIVDMPFAISTHVTLGGIIEEHNGAPLRNITLSGSFGVVFGRDKVLTPAKKQNFAEAIFAGTVQEARATGKKLLQVSASNNRPTNTIDDSRFRDANDLGKLTGYYQFMLLKYYLESYADLKKQIEGRPVRLAFAMWKRDEVYLVTPVQYQVTQSAESPLEYRYSLGLKAYKRIQLDAGGVGAVKKYTPVQRNPNGLANMLQVIENSRLVLQGARKTIMALGGDVDRTIFEPIRELCLFCKDAMAVPMSVADLGDSIIQSLKSTILDVVATKQDFADFRSSANDRFNAVKLDQETIDTFARLKGLATERASTTTAGTALQAGLDNHPGNNPFLKPKEAYKLLSSIPVGSLPLSPGMAAKIATERGRVRNLTRLDFEKRRDDLERATAVLANALGLGGDRYNEVYGLDAPTTAAVSEATDEDFEALYALEQVVTELNRLVVTNTNEPTSKLDAISAVAGMASKSGIAFKVPRSKYAVPFPYKSTLEQLAYRYLGDPGRWHEIAALNGLQTPYVDEEGFDLDLLTNGSNSTVLVNDASGLFVGQPVWITSSTTPTTNRRIAGIDHLTPTQHLVSVDGEANMGDFKTIAGAKLHAFLPNTVNSQQTIFIPSDQDPQEGDFKTKAIPGVDENDRLLAVAGIDLLLTPKNDLIIPTDGTGRWAVGLNNIVQQVRLPLSTRQGTHMNRPGYGLPITAGDSVSDISPTDIAAALEAMFANNPTFKGVEAVQVKVNGPTVSIQAAVEVAGVQKVVPISVEVTT